MRFRMMMTAVAAVGLLATGAHAQTAPQAAPQTGQWRAALEKMVTEASAGVCASEVMAPDLLAACSAQIDGMADALGALGPVVSIRFVSAQGEGAERIETYAVQYGGGQTLNWSLGGYADGKFSIAYPGN